jgi:hypothetical protein
MVGNSGPNQDLTTPELPVTRPESPQKCLTYDGVVTYESVIRDLFKRIPALEPIYRKMLPYLEGEEPS